MRRLAVPLALIVGVWLVPASSVTTPAHAAGPGKLDLPVATGAPYRIGYTSGESVRIAAVNPATQAQQAGPLGTEEAQQVSSRGGALAYVSYQYGNAEILYRPAPGAQARRLTTDPAVDRRPALSPDGTQVAFESNRAGQYDIWVVGVDGGGLRQLTDGPGDETWPTWSPTGDRIAFSSDGEDPAGDLYVVPSAGGAAARLTADPAVDIQPAWSPTGETIAFTTTRFQPKGGTSSDIATVSVPVGTPRKVAEGDQAAWSADGTKLAYVVRGADPGGDVVVRTMASSAVTQVAHQGDRAETEPSFASNGTLFYTTATDGEVGGAQTDIWSATSTGSNRVDSTNQSSSNEADLAYSPDGLRMAYSKSDEQGVGYIVIADADGRNPKPLTKPDRYAEDRDPTWSPDGTMIAFGRTPYGSEWTGSSSVVIVRVADGVELGTIAVPSYLTADDIEPAWSPDGTHIAISRSAEPVPTTQVVPGSVDRPVAAGDSTSVTSTVRTPVVPPTPDIVLLIDATGSMESTLGALRTKLGTVIDSVQKAQSKAQFAIATYRDYDDGADMFRVVAPLTADVNALRTQMGTIKAFGGGDTPEAWANGLYQVSTGAIKYRENSSRVVVLIGDAQSNNESHTIPQAITALTGAKARVVAVDVGGLDAKGQATQVVNATNGRLVKSDPQTVSDAILGGLHNLDVTVTPTVGGCDQGAHVTFDPQTTTVAAGVDATLREIISVDRNAVVGSELHCTVQYKLNPDPGQTGYTQAIKVTVTDPGLPRVVVDDLLVSTAGSPATVTYQATATDASGKQLVPTCTPASGSRFPVGQTVVTCTATDSAGRVGRDTANIDVLDTGLHASRRIWLAKLTFPAKDRIVATDQIDLSSAVGQPCAARSDDRGPAWSPNGTSLAFSASGVLCVVDAAGGSARVPITQSAAGGYVDDPAWSPDGTTIAYGLSRSSDRETTIRSIAAVPAKGGNQTVLVTSPGGAWQPVFLRLAERGPFTTFAAGLTMRSEGTPADGYLGGAEVVVNFVITNQAKYPVYRVRLGAQLPQEVGGAILYTDVGTIPARGSAAVAVKVPTTAAVTAGIVQAAVTGVYVEEVATTASAQETVNIKASVLRLSTEVAQVGTVVTVTGSGFPAGETINLKWSRGITQQTDVVVAADGTLESPMLIFHNDQLGDRFLVASSPKLASAQAPVLVVPQTQQPPDFISR